MKSLSPVLMIQGTSSNVGKSLITTALCRWFALRGYKVAPFKAQNMALNAGVTKDGGEIGRAQMIQAEAAGVEPTVFMNPLLLKPEGDRHSQLVLLGKPAGRYHFASYHEQKPKLREIILSSLQQLRESYDLVIVEGAGSPAEVNLKAHDLVNMFVAKSVGALVLLVGDIDRGGIFASLLGTMDLLDDDERDLVAGFIINKFRGDPALFVDGVRFIEERSSRPVFGVLPYMKNHGIAEEDSLGLESRHDRLRRDPLGIDIAVIRLPRISNYDEFARLEEEPDVHVSYITDPREVADADLVIVPGSKATISDLQWLRERGFGEALKKRQAACRPLMAICGGYQMLGMMVEDEHEVEASVSRMEGLGLLPIRTHFGPEKITRQRNLFMRQEPQWMKGAKGLSVLAYEIHMGIVQPAETAEDCHKIFQDQIDQSWEGSLDGTAWVLGTLMHGLFDNQELRQVTVRNLRHLKGLDHCATVRPDRRQADFNALAETLDQHLNMPVLVKLLKLNSPEQSDAIFHTHS